MTPHPLLIHPLLCGGVEQTCWECEGPITAPSLHLDLDRRWKPFRLGDDECRPFPFLQAARNPCTCFLHIGSVQNEWPFRMWPIGTSEAQWQGDRGPEGRRLQAHNKSLVPSESCSKQEIQAGQGKSSKPGRIFWMKRREQIKGNTVQMVAGLIPGTIALPSAAQTGRPGSLK